MSPEHGVTEERVSVSVGRRRKRRGGEGGGEDAKMEEGEEEEEEEEMEAEEEGEEEVEKEEEEEEEEEEVQKKSIYLTVILGRHVGHIVPAGLMLDQCCTRGHTRTANYGL